MSDSNHSSERPLDAASQNAANRPKGEVAPDVKPQPQESWVEAVKTIVYALLIAVVIRTFVFQPFNIPSGSMEDTLLIGDYIFVSKFAYGYSRYSFPFGMGPFEGRVMARQPHRGDVVVFKLPSDNSTDYIKRVIGTPGDRIQMIDGVLQLNGQAIPKVRVDDYIEDIGGYERHVPKFRETLPGGKSYYVLDRESNNPLDNTPVFVVPEGHYFMMGDNRDNSSDSRAEGSGVGYVPYENLVGQAEVIFFSHDGSARLWELWKWPFAVRYGRIAKLVD